jgi:hypothetical protein
MVLCITLVYGCPLGDTYRLLNQVKHEKQIIKYTDNS